MHPAAIRRSARPSQCRTHGIRKAGVHPPTHCAPFTTRRPAHRRPAVGHGYMYGPQLFTFCTTYHCSGSDSPQLEPAERRPHHCHCAVHRKRGFRNDSSGRRTPRPGNLLSALQYFGSHRLPCITRAGPWKHQMARGNSLRSGVEPNPADAKVMQAG